MTRFLTLMAGAAVGLAAPGWAADRAAVLANYADIAHAGYGDSLAAAERLWAAVDALIAAPSAEAMQAARAAWLAARVPYQQTEVFRFGNPIVDEWEGKVNAWPLDEGLIDYVDASYGGATDENPYAALNVIANTSFALSGGTVDATEITPELLEGTLQEADAIESNVATGYHAIEFLLWGQDLNGTGPGAGNRPWTDYAAGDACTGDHCDRRAAYLKAATDLLVSDLEWIVAQWADGGAARTNLTVDEGLGVAAVLTGMGSLSYGEQAGERMRLGLMLHDPEEEHDCFSDNTYNSHFYDGVGVRNVYLGRYVRTDGSVVEGPSVSELVAEADPALDAELRAALDKSVLALDRDQDRRRGGHALRPAARPRATPTGEALVMGAIDALIAQTALDRAGGRPRSSSRAWPSRIGQPRRTRTRFL